MTTMEEIVFIMHDTDGKLKETETFLPGNVYLTIKYERTISVAIPNDIHLHMSPDEYAKTRTNARNLLMALIKVDMDKEI